MFGYASSSVSSVQLASSHRSWRLSGLYSAQYSGKLGFESRLGDRLHWDFVLLYGNPGMVPWTRILPHLFSAHNLLPSCHSKLYKKTSHKMNQELISQNLTPIISTTSERYSLLTFSLLGPNFSLLCFFSVLTGKCWYSSQIRSRSLLPT